MLHFCVGVWSSNGEQFSALYVPWFSYEEHLNLDGYINKQNVWFWDLPLPAHCIQTEL
jgi:hypothetical protein